MPELFLDQDTQLSTENLLVNHRLIPIEDGVFFKLSTGFTRQHTTFSSKQLLEEHFTVFNFCLKGTQDFTLTGNYLPTHATSQHSNLLLLPNEVFNTEINITGEFAQASLFIPLKKYFDILGSAIDILPINFKNAAEKHNVCYFKNHNWHPRIRQVITQLLFQKLSPVSEKLLLESKMLEIIAVMIELDKINSDATNYFPKKDEEKIRYAKEIIEKEIEDPPSLNALAKRIGSNEFTLKKGFKLMYGMAVYQYLSHFRMNQANILLSSTNLSIHEIASSVGYENLSAFTRAFKKQYQILPSQLRKTPY